LFLLPQTRADPEIGFRGHLQCPFLGAEGTEPESLRRRERDAQGLEASENGERYSLHSRLGDLGSVVNSPSKAPTETEFEKYEYQRSHLHVGTYCTEFSATIA